MKLKAGSDNAVLVIGKKKKKKKIYYHSGLWTCGIKKEIITWHFARLFSIAQFRTCFLIRISKYLRLI